MQVFDLFFKVLKKKYVAALVFIVVFLVISYGLSNSEDHTTEFKESVLDVAVMDEDGTEQSKALTEFIGKKHRIKNVDSDRENMTELLYWEEVDYILVIKKGFAGNLAGGSDELFEEYRVHDSFSSVYMSNILNEYVKTARAYIASGADAEAASRMTSETLGRDTEVTYWSDMGQGPEEYSRWFAHYFQYMPYILISVMLSALGTVLGSLNKRNVRARTDCSSLSPRKATVQLFAASAVFVIVIWLIFIIAGALMKGGMYEGKAWLAVLNSFVFTIVAAAIAMLVSSFDLDDNVVSLITQIVGLGMSFLCGIFVPLSMLSEGVISVARFLPGYWYIRANDMLCGTTAFSAGEFAVCIAIQFGFAAVLLIATMAVRRSKAKDAVY
ncbi:MAG: ABC transporter permease [Ruminococcus sp.]|nr:ABC transporter permease [Ruminococcus sp.]